MYGFIGKFGDLRGILYADETHAQLFHVGGEQGEGGEGGGAYRESLAGRGGGVAERVEHVGALADFLAEAGHFGVAAGVVGYGAVGIGCERDSEGGEHSYGRDAYSV